MKRAYPFINRSLTGLISVTVSLFLSFFILKSYYLISSDPAEVSFFQMLRFYSDDVLASAIIGALSVIFCSLIHVIAIPVILFSVISFIYASVIGNFIDSRIYYFLEDIRFLKGSIAAEIHPEHIILALTLFTAYAGCFRILSLKLKGIKRSACLILYSGILIIFIGLRLIPVMQNTNDLEKNPLIEFVASHFQNARKELSQQDTGEFSDQSIYDELYRETYRNPVPISTRPDSSYNVVMIFLESTSNKSRSAGGRETMPNFRKLSEHGAYWKNFYSPVTRSISSIFSALTGHYSAASMTVITDVRPRFPVKALPEYFKERGYSTALLHASTFEYSDKLSFLKDRGYDLLVDAEELSAQGSYAENYWGIDDRAMYDYAKKWIDSRDNPFFLTLIPIYPHHPYDLPPDADKPFGKETFLDRYHNSLHYHDQLLGDFIKHLKNTGKYEKTVFVIFGDHGEAFGQHGTNKIHGTSVYEEDVNVPMLISNPDVFQTPVLSEAVGTIPDITPTVLDLFGIKNEEKNTDGMSLLNPAKNRMVFMTAFKRSNIYALRDGDLKFIYYPEQNISYLFNLHEDPNEQNNISHLHLNKTDFYRRQCANWMSYTNEKIRSYRTSEGKGDFIDLAGYPIYFLASAQGRFEKIKSTEEKPLTAGDQTFTKALDLSAPSIITYDISTLGKRRLTGKFVRNNFTVDRSSGQASFEIWVDGRTVFKENKVGKNPVSFDVEIEGGRLSLVANTNIRSYVGDRILWIDPKLDYIQP